MPFCIQRTHRWIVITGGSDTTFAGGIGLATQIFRITFALARLFHGKRLF